MSDLERSHAAAIAAKNEIIETLRREVRLRTRLGDQAFEALVDVIHTTAATGPLAAVHKTMEWLVEHEVDVDWHELDDDWLSKWEAS